ncbi:hypothetical protein GQ600_10946 [Phytophthora cactorum]|nr:hypothetical protein GQ600_10946 [Phytophthora cactorum]
MNVFGSYMIAMHPSEEYRFCGYDVFAFSIDHNGICNTHGIVSWLDRRFLAASSGERNFTLQGFVYGDERPILLRARVVSLHKQYRASNCCPQQLLLELFRELPSVYPDYNRWGKGNTGCQPIDSRIVTALTRPLTREDTITDERWINGSVILCTSNIDRAVLNSCMATEITRRSQTLLFRWRKPLLGDVPQSAQELLHNEKEHLELFGYCYYNAPGQVLDNCNGMSILALQMELGAEAATALRLTEEALQSGKTIVELPVAPAFINVRLADRDGRLLSASE